MKQQAYIKQLKTLIPILLMAYLPILAVLIGVGFYAIATGRRVWFFTVEPFLIGNLPFYAGFLSTVGNVFWASTAAICFFTAWVLKTNEQQKPYKLFLSLVGLLTALLLFDGFFQMHRILYPKYLHIPMVFILGFYAFFLLGVLGRFWKQIRETEFLLLALALIFFFLAFIFDLGSILSRGNTAFSDGFKLFGIVSWLLYFVRTSRYALLL
jgi:hypothetical protein